jgi:hypothetical protein
MNEIKSFEYTFFHLINKCILLFKYIDIVYQKEILDDIKKFINKLQEIFSKADFKTSEEKKNKILEVLIHYFENIINNKIYNLISDDNKDYIIKETDKIALNPNQNMKKNIIENDNDILLKNNQNIEIFKNVEISNDIKNENKINNTIIWDDIEKKINNKLKVAFTDIEKNIKLSLKENIENTQHIEYDLEKKFNSKIENKIKELLKDIINNKDKLNSGNIVENKINDIDIKQKIDVQINEKIKLLSTIFNENIQKLVSNLNTKIDINEKELIKLFDDKINSNNFNKNNFNIVFDKDNNEIKLLYLNEIITSSKINIKGLIGPKGPQGSKGDKGDSPIIRKIEFTDDKKLKLIIQESGNIYEIISGDTIPLGPQGIQGEPGIQGKTTIELKWNQDNVMRIDDDNNDSIVFLKSLCIGDKSHCIKDNSLAIGGGVCYQNNSLSLGNNSKTLDSDSISLFGSCIGKKAFSYRADNVDENTVQFGKKDKLNYNINSYNIASKEINLECETFRIKTNKFENSKILEMEDRLVFLEKKIVDILKKI